MLRGSDGPAYARGEIFTEEAGKVLVEVEIPGRGANRVQVNRSRVRRKRDLRRQVRAVYFGPDDLVIVIGDPSKRRDFLDDAIRSLWPLKESAMTAYDRTLRQRNRLIKEWEGRGAPPGLEAWDAELVQNGSALIRLRAEAASRLARPRLRGVPAPGRLRHGGGVRAERIRGAARGGLREATGRAAGRRARPAFYARRPASGRPRPCCPRPGGTKLREPRGGVGGGAVPAPRPGLGGGGRGARDARPAARRSVLGPGSAAPASGRGAPG